jgi:hypothetical protein
MKQVKIGIGLFVATLCLMAITLTVLACCAKSIDAQQSRVDWKSLGRCTYIREYENEWGKFLIFRGTDCISIIQVMHK